MPSDRSILIDSFNVSDGRTLEVEVSYTTGGRAMFTGHHIQRGYRVTAVLVKITPCDGYAIRTTTLLDNSSLYVDIEAAPRFNKNRLHEIAATIRNDARYEQLMTQLLHQNNVTIIQPTFANPTASATPEQATESTGETSAEDSSSAVDAVNTAAASTISESSAIQENAAAPANPAESVVAENSAPPETDAATPVTPLTETPASRVVPARPNSPAALGQIQFEFAA